MESTGHLTDGLRRLMAQSYVSCLCALLGGLAVGMWSFAGNAATFKLARRADGIVVAGVKVEGNIVPGDAQKLLDFYRKYGELISPVYLRSNGGNVAEAMTMGAIIRRLRLETSVPVWDTGRAPIDQIKVDHQENTVLHPAFFKAASCMAGFWSSVLTRA